MDRAVLMGYMLIIAILIGSAMLAKKSEVLRDKNARVASGRAPYSLSRTQLFIWTLIVSCCFILACAYKGEFNGIINQSTVILMGISVGTLVSGSLVDTSNQNDEEGTGEIAKMAVVRKRGGKDKSSFIADILSDGRGVSINRFQSVVFTVIFMCIFVYKFAASGSFAEFGSTELMLMGISQAGYIGAKASEGTAPSAPAAPARKSEEENPRGIELKDEPSGEDVSGEGN